MMQKFVPIIQFRLKNSGNPRTKKIIKYHKRGSFFSMITYQNWPKKKSALRRHYTENFLISPGYPLIIRHSIIHFCQLSAHAFWLSFAFSNRIFTFSFTKFSLKNRWCNSRKALRFLQINENFDTTCLKIDKIWMKSHKKGVPSFEYYNTLLVFPINVCSNAYLTSLEILKNSFGPSHQLR